MAIFRPTNLQPNSTAVDTDNNNDFTCVIQGTVVVEYRVNIKRVTNNAIVYTSGDVTLTNPLYNGDTLTITIPSTANLDNGTDYKWEIAVKETASSTAVTSEESRFFARTDPVVRITNIPLDGEINVRNFVLEGSYTQAENVSLRWHQWKIFDNNLNLLEDTDKIFNANLTYNYDRYLNGQTYYAELIVENQESTVASSGTRGMNVVYTFPPISTSVMATNNPVDNSAKVDFANATQIPGTGSNFNYINNVPFTGTNSVVIGDGGSVNYGTRNGENITSLGATQFLHTRLSNNIQSLNRIGDPLDGFVDGVFFSIENEQFIDNGNGTGRVVIDDYVLAFEDYIFKIYVRFLGGMWVLVNQYPTYSTIDFCLQDSPTFVEGTYYRWDDSQAWDDTKFWVDSENLDDVFWKLTWFWGINQLQWERSADS